jgi:hypothetical protein
MNINPSIDPGSNPGPIPGLTPGDALQLHDIHVPGAPALWPPAPGWWLVAGVTLVVLVTLGLWLLRRRRQARFRHRVLRDLEQLSDQNAKHGRATLSARVSALLKRVALARYARSEVAALSGRAWLAFLDRTGGGGKFEHGPGQVLASGPYAPDTPIEDSQALIELSKSWVRRNL